MNTVCVLHVVDISMMVIYCAYIFCEYLLTAWWDYTAVGNTRVLFSWPKRKSSDSEGTLFEDYGNILCPGLHGGKTAGGHSTLVGIDKGKDSRFLKCVYSILSLSLWRCDNNLFFFSRKTKLKEMKSKNDELKKVKEKRKELMNGEGEEKGKTEDAQSKYIGGCQIEPYSLNTK